MNEPVGDECGGGHVASLARRTREPTRLPAATEPVRTSRYSRREHTRSRRVRGRDRWKRPRTRRSRQVSRRPARMRDTRSHPFGCSRSSVVVLWLRPIASSLWMDGSSPVDDQRLARGDRQQVADLPGDVAAVYLISWSVAQLGQAEWILRLPSSAAECAAVDLMYRLAIGCSIGDFARLTVVTFVVWPRSRSRPRMLVAYAIAIMLAVGSSARPRSLDGRGSHKGCASLRSLVVRSSSTRTTSSSSSSHRSSVRVRSRAEGILERGSRSSAVDRVRSPR